MNYNYPKDFSDLNIDGEIEAVERGYRQLEATTDELETEGKLEQAIIVRRINRRIREQAIGYLQFIRRLKE